ncbi:oxidoreductase [Sanguibacter suaedae]|uniref:Oxidoreductase n=1 Tax=Sanguibacter suaedae TaxID=2795737 RepID=A0A934I300_9MICO|nr:oxidoreductase [Sanguibacter suaedae]MBI9114273.1 oxidoreductase [Sanguibacter suaedae]
MARPSWYTRLFTRRAPETPVGSPSVPDDRDRRRETVEHLAEFTRSRVGVESYIEPPTHDQPTSLLLVATTGEWTRRRVPDAFVARKIAAEIGIPVYDVNFTGYPQRMRDWNSAQRRKKR